MTLDEVASHFENVRASGASRSARCPCHDDNRNSVNLSNGDKGVVVMCHACGKERTEEILTAVGLTFADLFYENNGNGHHSMNIVAIYLWRDDKGAELYQTIRMEPKDFRVRRSDGNGGYVWNLGKTHRVLYRLPELVKADLETVVHLVEGEKDADRLASLGLLATTSTFGANAPWRNDYNKYLEGRHVVIIQDHDEPGAKYAQDRAEHLHGVAASVKVVDLYDGPLQEKHGKDVSDWLNEGHDLEELVRITEAAPEWTTDDLDIQKHIDSGVANMERLVAQHHQDVRYLYRVGWYAWDRRRFAPNAEATIVRRAIRTIRSMYHEAPTIADKQERDSFLKHIRKSESDPEIQRMIHLAQSDESIYVPEPEHFDRDPKLFNAHNGTVDVRTGQLHPHRREDLITKLGGCAYDPKATCPTWMTFLETVFDGDQDMIAFVQRLAGYCLTGEVREHVLPILWGDGNNGKTTLVETLLNLMGEYATPAMPDLLVVRKHKEHPTELMDLRGARFVVTDETPKGAYLNESLVKHLTGGDTLKARRLYQEPIEFKPTHKLLMATNHKPVVHGTDIAIWRRLLLVPFTITIPPQDRDLRLREKLDLELPGVFNWVLQGCTDWQKDGLNPPRQVQAATDEYRGESDHLPTFLEEVCVESKYAKAEKGFMYVEYTRWCERNGEDAMPKMELGRRLKAKGVTDMMSNGRRYWSGVEVRPPRAEKTGGQ